MTYLLDTDTFTLAYHRKHGLRERTAAAQRADTVAVPLVTRIEVLEGRFAAVLKAADGAALSRALDGLRQSEAYLGTFPVESFGPGATAVFDHLRDDKSARKVGRNDLLIACIALALGATVVTRNTKDFTLIPGVKFVNWAD